MKIVPFHQEGKTMKKITIVLLVIAMFLCLTACSQDQYAKLGDLMGKMSGNVYGLKADMKDVDAATENVDEAVTVNAETGAVSVEIKSEDAQKIVESVVAVKDSSTKREALQKSLEEPILGEEATAEQKVELKQQMTVQATESKIDVESQEYSNYTEERKELAEAVNTILDSVGESLSENPTKAELATVAVVKTLADAVKSDEGYADAGKNALEALKVTSEVANIDVFANVSVSDLLSNMSFKGISRDGSSEDVEKYLPLLSKTAAALVNCMVDGQGRFSVQRYNKFIMECKLIKASYEMIARHFAVRGDVDAILGKQIDMGLTIENLGSYLIATVFADLDMYSTKGDVQLIAKKAERNEEYSGKALRSFYKAYIDDNYEKLTDLENNYKNLADPTKEDSAYGDLLVLAVNSLAFGIGIDPYAEGFNDEVLMTEMKAAFNENGALGSEVFNILSVTGMILVDSEYTKLLSMDSSMDGTLSGLREKITK